MGAAGLAAARGRPALAAARRGRGPAVAAAGRRLAGAAVLLALVLAALLGGAGAGEAGAHAGLVRSDPAAGAALGASPTARPADVLRARRAVAVGQVRVLDAAARRSRTARRRAVPGDPSSLQVAAAHVAARRLHRDVAQPVGGRRARDLGVLRVRRRRDADRRRGAHDEHEPRRLGLRDARPLPADRRARRAARRRGRRRRGLRGRRGRASCGSPRRLAARGGRPRAALRRPAAQRRRLVGELLDSDVGAALVRRGGRWSPPPGLALPSAWRWRGDARPPRRVALALAAAATAAGARDGGARRGRARRRGHAGRARSRRRAVGALRRRRHLGRRARRAAARPARRDRRPPGRVACAASRPSR